MVSDFILLVTVLCIRGVSHENTKLRKLAHAINRDFLSFKIKKKHVLEQK